MQLVVQDKIEVDLSALELILYKKFPTYYGSVEYNTSMMTSSENMDVLIIEDSVATAGVISDYLRQLDYKRIHICNDGEGGINKFLELSSSSRSPLVFLDYYLPDMNAGSVFKKLIEAQPKAKIIIQTVGGRYDEGINYLIQQGAYHFLPKPFSFDDLKQMMNKFETEQVVFVQK